MEETRESGHEATVRDERIFVQHSHQNAVQNSTKQMGCHDEKVITHFVASTQQIVIKLTQRRARHPRLCQFE